MSVAPHDERRSFLFFLIFILGTAFVLSFYASSSLVLGFLGIVWGVFGFFRLFYVTQYQSGAFSKILSLPSKILFGLEKQEQARREFVFKRFASVDVIFWFCSALAFILWALYCSFFPAEITVVQTLRLKQELLLDVPIKNIIDPYAIMMSLSSYGIIGIIICTALSYSHNDAALRWTFYSLFSVFFIGAALAFVFLSPASPALWVNLTIIKGGGLGQANILHILVPEIMEKSGTGLVKRFTEMGMVGAYGVYVIFLPVFIMLVKMFFDKRYTALFPSVGLICIFILAALDIYWISSPFIDGLGILGVTVLSLYWGTAKRFG